MKSTPSMQMTSKNRLMAEGGHILAEIINRVASAAKEGVSGLELDALANSLCANRKVTPAFLGYRGYPATLCVSLNNTVVHGIPSREKIKNGDIVGLDMGIKHRGYFTDMAVTVGVGKISDQARLLMKATKEALDVGISSARAGVHVGDLGNKIGAVAEKYHLGIVKELSGHGIGKELQTEPSIPNYGSPGKGFILNEGMTIAIEPMFSLKSPEVKTARDGWAVLLPEGSLGAHFEHTIVVGRRGGHILTI